MDFLTALVFVTGFLSALTGVGAIFSSQSKDVVQSGVFWIAVIWIATGIGLLIT